MKIKNKLIIAAFGIMSVIICAAQNNDSGSSSQSQMFKRDFHTIEFESPNEWSFHKYIEKPVNLYNGSVDVSVPLYELKDGEISIPITLRYNTSGIRVDEEASWVGLGWNLNVGGYLTQRIVGGFDDADETFDLYYKDMFYNGQTGYVHSHGRIEFTRDMYDQILDPRQDADMNHRGRLEPDVYYFSYPGKSGRYVVDQRDNSIIILQREQDIVIDNTATGVNQYSNYPGKIITTPEGIKHHYNSSHTTIVTGATYPVSVSYPLTRSVYPDGSEVVYSYGSYPIKRHTYSASISGSLMPYDLSLVGVLNEYSTVNHGSTELNINETYLQNIETPNYRIVFVTTTRLDVVSESTSSMSKRLQQIRIIDKATNQCVKAFQFEQSYFGADINDSRFKRLKLDAVKEISPSDNNQAINRYSFTYNTSHALPSKESYASDYWGYPNSSQEIMASNCFPDLSRLYWSRLSNDDYRRICAINMYPHYDKSHNYDYCQTGMLTSITYPTGGRTEFEYGSNSFWGEIIPSASEHQYEAAQTVRHSILDRNSASADNPTVSVATTGPRDIHVDYILNRGLNTWGQLSNYHPLVRIPFANTDASQGTLVDLSAECWQMNDHGDSGTTISGRTTVSTSRAGTTVFQVDFPDALGDQNQSNGNHGSMSASIWYSDADPGSVSNIGESYGCGMRVEKIKYFDAGAATPMMTKSYSYVNPDDERTSGVLFDRPKYESIYNNAILPITFGSTVVTSCCVRVFNISSNTVLSNPYGWSSGVGYSCVTETVEGANCGRIEYNFINIPINEGG